MVINFKCPLIQNNGTFYTDTNGLDMIKRDIVYNGTRDYSKNEEDLPHDYNGIPENYYPITTSIIIQSKMSKVESKSMI